MYPPDFEYYAPTRIDDALNLLSEHGEDAKILAGGQSLIPLLKLRLASFPYIIDISGIEDMKYIKEEEEQLRIGSVVTIGDVEDNAMVKSSYYILHEIAAQIADPLVRNRGTVGGNITHGDPSNDMPAGMIALKAKLVLQGKKGKRIVDSDSFILEPFTTILEEGEILTEILIPKASTQTGGCYIKQRKNAGDFSVAAIAVQLTLNEDERVEKAGIGLVSVAPRPVRAAKAERYIEGEKINDSTVKEVAKIIVEESEPSTDFYGSAEFKKKILGIISEDAINLAFERALENE